jgi:phosphoglycerol transferase MdoB-like AlkP superfamily enzyme
MSLASSARTASPVEPETQIPVALRLIALGWAGMTLQEVLLFARPTPYGGPYVLHWDRYFWFAILYNLLGLMVASLPFLAAWLLRRRPVAAAAARRAHALHLGVILFVTALDQADNEVMRFMGTHLTVSLLRTYERVGAWGADNLHIIAGDHGGPFLPFVVLLGLPVLLWWKGRRLIEAGLARPARWAPRFRWSALALPLMGPLVVFILPGGRFRRAKIQPELFTLAFEVGQAARDATRPTDYATLVRAFQTEWLADNGDSTWRFAGDTLTPLLRTPVTPATPTGTPWNVIYLQLETFRAWNVGHLHPDARGSATPVLDSLAAAPTGATWTRHLSFGPPTVSGFVAGHCSIRPHSAREITTTFTYTGLLCLPAVLRALGWHTAYFTGSDPDWDNQTIWLRRWYDEIAFYRDADEDDRIVFGRAGVRIRELGRSGKPFFATVISISNHYPFRSRDHAFDLTDSTTPGEAIRNTMHFTDRVVGRFLDALSTEPWFAHTLVVIVGDHGYNLGEHDGTAGQRNGWRESVWVPLIMVGAHPRLPHGRHDEVASILDVAPTVSDLLGVRQPVPWLGRSLVTRAGPGRTITMDRGTTLYAEDDRFGLVLNPATGQAALYDPGTDPLQQHDIAASHPAETARLLARAARDQRLTDFLIEADRVWRGPATP